MSNASAETLRNAQSQKTRNSARGGINTLLQSIGGALWLPQAGCLALLVDELVTNASLNQCVTLLSLAFLMFAILRASLSSWINLRNVTGAAQSVLDLRQDAVEQFARQSPLNVKRPPAGALASTLTEQAQSIVGYLARYQPARARSTLIPLLILIAVTPLSWVAGLILLLSAPLIPLFMALVGWRAKAISEMHLVELADMNAFMLDRLRAMQTLRALRAVEVSAQAIAQRAHSLRKRIMAVLKVAFLSSAVLELFSALGVAMVAVYIGFHLLGDLNFGAWGKTLTLSQGLFILLLAPAFYEPLRDLASAWHDRADGQAAQEQIQRLGLAAQALPGGNADKRQPCTSTCDQAPAVVINNLGFRYGEESAPVFESLSLQIQAGEHLAVMMPSGGGKSTLLSLIAGLAAYDSGEISIGGKVLNLDNAQHLRQNMAWIGQKPHIFAGSLATNITLGREIDQTTLATAIEQAQLARFMALRGNVQLAEGGAGMSGGELVRLSIARALVDSSATLLLVDEPTAHLDTQTAASVTAQLMQAAQGRTMLIVTHDPLLAASAHRTVHLKSRVPAEQADLS